MYLISSIATSDNLLNVWTILGLNSCFMYGITMLRILFLVYSFSKFVLSILGFNSYFSQYCSISLRSHSISGRINLLSLIGSIPLSPESPLPLSKCIIIVSILSFILCAIAILFEFVFFNISSKNSYLAFLPASSVPIFLSFAILTTSILFM